jgi:hypothetical protein
MLGADRLLGAPITGNANAQVVPAVLQLRLGVQPDLAVPSSISEQALISAERPTVNYELRYLGWGEIVDSLAGGGLDVGLISPVAHL